MIMVRRRARPAKETGGGSAAAAVASDGALSMDTAAAVAVAGGNHLLDDQYFASPKRKDCRLMKASENLKISSDVVALEEEANNKGVKPTKALTDRTIGVPLATRSQTRTIENFFKANAAAKCGITLNTHHPEPIKEQKTISTAELPLSDELGDEELERVVGDLLYDGHSTASSDSPSYQHENEHEEVMQDTFALRETSPVPVLMADFQTHRSGLRDSHSSSHSSSSSGGASATTDNIFLQEPVLTLDIDRTPTKASSIKINKSFELASAVFSSPPSVLNACRFNQIVTLNGGGQCEPQPVVVAQPQPQPQLQLQPHHNGFELDQHDSSSCDSGVACSLTISAESPAAGGGAGAAARRRKPATPHRILCPSPIKTLPRGDGGGLIVPGARKTSGIMMKGDLLSPRKSPRKLPTTTAAVAACKSRRRLNQPKPQAPYQPQQPQPPPGTQPTNEDVVVIDDDEDDDDQEEDEGEEDEDDVHALLKAAEELENLNKIPIANSNKSNNHVKAMLKPAPAKPRAALTKGGSKTKTGSKIQPGPLPLAATNGNREMTDFFPVRRSVRKTKTAVKEEWLRNLEQAVLEERSEGLQVRNFMGKGRGVVAVRHFKRNEFVVEYVGDLISISDATDRERRYALDENAGCYMYYFKHKNQQYCIDATVDTGKLGRLINHSRAGNLMTKVVVIKQRPHLVLLAKDDIAPGEELTYDYGDRSKESLLHHPWLAF
ncbi:GL23503 [Drosophila persimilis]|uniref:Histone-lysine N-methyltransferase Set8 n=1 Tax=Drosophila persimilis TaxID=7234 RepID=B4G332_DROPE|nr:histone-lysine N-methyltransferase PR-Set7 [Drosophila persimilis]XP_026840573.1 histone-lysine N-methyltransferase PR-Set7 [Drosophila persimilis]EDW24227.1 GL23503 [Drosophila persimilis]